MKKTLLILLVTIVLAACGGNKDDLSEPTEEPVKEPDQAEEAGTDKGEEDKSEDKEEAAEKDSTKADNSAIEEFDEYDVIAEHLDLDAYTGIVEADNEGNRIILFEDDNGEKEFKSILVKNDNQLKIISLNDDTQPLYNDNIN